MVESVGCMVKGLKFMARATQRVFPQPRSHRARQVWLRLEIWGGWGGGAGNYVHFSDSHLNLQNAVFRKPSCKSTAFMFDSIRLLKHACPNQNDVHVRGHPITRTSMPKL